MKKRDILFRIRKGNDKDFDQILSLQKKAHFANVSISEKQEEGFVSVETEISQLDELNNRIGILVATDGEKIVGYELPLDLEISNKIGLLKPFIERILKIDYQGKTLDKYKWVIEGQININKDYKGKGIAEELHKKFIEMLRKKGYEIILIEISDQNPRSLHVHTKKLGLKVIQKYFAEGRSWFILLQDIRDD